MTRISWGTVGERFYKTGVDRGVLYPESGPGVAWNGLTAVNEAPTGGTPRPFYYDGFKYANLASAEEFAATIEAFSSPLEFASCDGTESISNGLFITHQRRKSFGLAYRTKLGNDIDGTDHGYKLHIVYGALAAPSEKAHSTLSDNAEAMTHSWAISTLAPSVAGYHPTAHFVVDSRLTPVFLMEALEDILYGSDLTLPRIPGPQELISLFET